jgi:hypothetical protein
VRDDGRESELSYRIVRGHRCYPPATDHARIASWLRACARTGFVRGMALQSQQYRDRCTCGVNLPEATNSVSLILTRDFILDLTGWHFSICCVTSTGYRGYQTSEGEHWIGLIFGRHKSRLIETDASSEIGEAKDVRHFFLACDWRDGTDPAVTLEELDS